jgi:acyl-CoA dehydrogenase
MSADSLFAQTANAIFAHAGEQPAGDMDRESWERIQDAGLDLLLMPESEGGAGDAFAEAVEVMSVAGRHAVAVPLAETLVANWCLAQAGQTIAPGPKALAIGTGPVVWAPTVDILVDVAGDASRVVALPVPAGSQGRTLADEPVLLLEEGFRPAVGWCPLPRRPDLPLAILALLKAAQIGGALDEITDLTIEYANTRRQFGRNIGAFQAVQHMVALIACETAAANAAVQFASAAQGDDDLVWRASVAKSRTSAAAGAVSALAHQVHGAIGFTREYRLQRLTRGVLAWRDQAGDEAYWNKRIGRSVLKSREELWAGMIRGFPV